MVLRARCDSVVADYWRSVGLFILLFFPKKRMRDRETIKNVCRNAPVDGFENRFDAILEVLLDIRDLLKEKQ